MDSKWTLKWWKVTVLAEIARKCNVTRIFMPALWRCWCSLLASDGQAVDPSCCCQFFCTGCWHIHEKCESWAARGTDQHSSNTPTFESKFSTCRMYNRIQFRSTNEYLSRKRFIQTSASSHCYGRKSTSARAHARAPTFQFVSALPTELSQNSFHMDTSSHRNGCSQLLTERAWLFQGSSLT